MLEMTKLAQTVGYQLTYGDLKNTSISEYLNLKALLESKYRQRGFLNEQTTT